MPPEEIPDDDTDIEDMTTLELQRERLKTQRVAARKAVDVGHAMRRIERYSMVTMIGVLGNGAYGIFQDPPRVTTTGEVGQAVVLILSWLGLV